MITVKKIDDNRNIEISDGNNSFIIARKGGPDPFWYPVVNNFFCDGDIIFTINESDGYIYLLFENFLQEVLEGNIFPLEEENLKGKSSLERKKIKRQKALENEENVLRAMQSGLIQNGEINCHSENYDEFDYASVLNIKKENNTIKVTFKKNIENLEDHYRQPTYCVRITEVGGWYGDFYVIFVRFKNTLLAIDWEKYNCHSEEVGAHTHKLSPVRKED